MVPMALLLAFFALLLAWEEASRGPASPAPDWPRLRTNWGLAAANFGLAALVPIAGMLSAGMAGRGILSHMPAAVALVILLLVRSLGAYWLHRMFHAQTWLWRIHRVHHADTTIDVSTGLRNHPLEALVVATFAGLAGWTLGPPLAIAAAADAALLAASFWHHAAISLPARWNERLEPVFITPRLHLLHHSRDRIDHDRNFGDFLSIWDRLFGTFSPARATAAPVGVDGEDWRAQSLARQLAAPFASR